MVDPRSCGARVLLLSAVAGLLASCGGGQSSFNGIQGGGNGRVINNGQGSGFDAGSPPDGSSTDGPVRAVGAACAACETQRCTSETDAGESFINDLAGYADYYGSCYNATGNATGGPASGTPLVDLCKAVLDCIHNTSCAVNGSGTFTGDSCYCGAGVDQTFCTSDAKGAHATGPCKHQIENAAQSVNPLIIGMQEFDPSSAYGAAMGLSFYCDSTDPVLQSGLPASASPCAAVCAGHASIGGSSGNNSAGGAGGGSSGGTGGHGGAAGAAVATGGSGGAAQSTGGAGGQQAVLELSPACVTCETDQAAQGTNPQCLSSYLTADPSGYGFGCSTLGSDAARIACDKLVACILTQQCSKNGSGTGPGDNPPVGCFCGSVSPTNCAAGGGADGPCVNEYAAAVLATPGAVPSGADMTAISLVITGGYGFDQTTAFGLANNITQCAIDFDCTTCRDLVTPTPVGGGGSGGNSVSAGGTGGVAAATGGVGGNGGHAGAAGTGGVAGGGSSGTGIGGSGGGSGGMAGGGGHAVAGSGGTGTGGGMAAVCPDLNKDTISDCAQTLVANSDLKQTSADWTPDTDAMIQWTALNGTSGSGSGSIEVENSGTTASDSSGFSREGAWQCVPVSETLTYLIDVQAYMPSGQGSGWAEFDLRYYSTLDCTGPDGGRDFVSPQGLATDTWMTLTGTTQIPLGIKSVALRLLAVKPAAGPPLKVDFDNALFIAD